MHYTGADRKRHGFTPAGVVLFVTSLVLWLTAIYALGQVIYGDANGWHVMLLVYCCIVVVLLVYPMRSWEIFIRLVREIIRVLGNRRMVKLYAVLAVLFGSALMVLWTLLALPWAVYDWVRPRYCYDRGTSRLYRTSHPRNGR
jgi:hypothetical protein